MPYRSASSSSRSTFARLATLGTLVAVLLVGVATVAVVPAGATAAPCIATATGAPWSYKGHKGTTYTILGENGASCSQGATWLKRITASHGTKSPKGWSCIAIASGVGECQVKGGGIFEFSPKMKK